MSVSDALKTRLDALLTDAGRQWLEEKRRADPTGLLTAFVAAPRFVGRKPVPTDAAFDAQLAALVPGWSLDGYTLDRLARVYLLLQLPADDEAAYVRGLETLFSTADLGELTALYSALPVFSFPQKWIFRATEAVRSNMGPVFDAVALGNPYPAAQFTEAAWNQLVLKAIFNAKPLHRITGFTERANATLAHDLSDLAHERWAAGRTVPPGAWQLVGPFVDEVIFEDLQKLFASPDEADRRAAVLVCAETGHEPARRLLAEHPDLHRAVSTGELTWKTLETPAVAA